MSIGVNFNSASVRTTQNLRVADRELSKVFERMSTGVRLNRSSDDPSSLVLANNLRYQLRGLQQASSNSEEGVNLLQTAEGALDGVSALLNRMRELAISAANEGVNSSSQLVGMQDELNAAIDSVNRVANDTRFGSIPLLNGALGGNSLSASARPYIKEVAFDASLLPGGVKAGSQIGVDVPLAGLSLDKSKNVVVLSTTSPALTPATLTTPIANLYQGDAAFGSPVQLTTVPATVSLTGASGTQTLALTNNTTIGDVLAQINSNGAINGLQASFDSTTGAFTVESTRFGAGNLSLGGTAMNGTTGLFVSDTTSAVNTYSTAGTNNQISINYTDLAGTFRAITLDQQSTSGTGLTFSNLAGGPEAAPPFTAYDIGAFSVTFKDLSDAVVGAPSTIPYDATYAATRQSATTIHTGALSNQQVAVDIPDVRASALGYSAGLVTRGLPTLQSLANSRALENGNAQEALQVIDASIDEISRTRGALGAVQSNSIETTIASLQVSIENLTSSESQLRDTDFAAESANFARQNILYQAATAMLAQANQVPQTVLKLLQNG
jgi:flagellin